MRAEKIHKRPTSDAERIAAGQTRFSFKNEAGEEIFYCFRPNLREANRAFRYRMEATRRKQEIIEQGKAEMTKRLMAYKRKLDKDERQRQVDAGFADLNKMTLFDLQQVDEMNQ